MRLQLISLALAAVAGVAHASALAVPLDHSVRLAVDGAASVVVGNPGVADVTVVDSRTVYVSGRAFGATDVIVLDRNGRTLFDGDVTVIRPASAVSVYRGATRVDFACAPACATNERPAAQASAGQSPLSALMQGMAAPPAPGQGQGH